MAKTAQKRVSTAGTRPSRKGATPETAKQTKKQIAMGRKQARQNRIIWLSIGGVGLVILLVLAFGLSQEFLIKPAQPVAIVDGAKVPLNDYQAMLQYQRYSLHNTIDSLNSAIASIDTSQSGADFLVSYYQQQLDQLNTELVTISDTTLEQMIDDALVKEKAQQVGITVTPADVQQTLDDQLQEVAASYAAAASPPVTDTQNITPTAVPASELDKYYQDALTAMGLDDKQFRGIIERGLYRSKLQDLLASQVPTTGLIIDVQMIVTDTQEAAVAAQTRIQNGEDFATVAKEVSSDPQVQDNGGDLGWVTTGQLSSSYGQAVEDLAFSMSVGQVSEVESNSSFYVIKIVDRNENGPLPETVLTQRQNSALQDWLTQRKDSPDVKIERLLQTSQIPPDPFATPVAG
jgi:parvulin-like peptidyl-prolyl isomerase